MAKVVYFLLFFFFLNRFATRERNALLLYNGRFNEKHDFIALEIVDEQIQLTFSGGSANFLQFPDCTSKPNIYPQVCTWACRHNLQFPRRALSLSAQKTKHPSAHLGAFFHCER